jgi:Flp pilus assembly protein TadG
VNKQNIPETANTHCRQTAHGQVMILFAVALIALVGMVALAVDAGFLMAERRQNQAAVDAAALSAAQAVLDNKDSTFVQLSGKSYGALNSSVSEGQVNVEWPAPGNGPQSGPYYVRVTITKEVQKFFLGAIYGGSWQVTNTAVAGVEPVPKPYALVALSPCPAAGIKLNGGVTVTINGGGSILSNCNITNTALGGSSSLVSVGGSIDAVGYIESNEQWYAADGINPGMRPVADPLKDATPPDPATLATITALPACMNDAICYIEPGVYNSLSFNVRNKVCMQPGIYYLTGSTKVTFQNNNSFLTNKPSECPLLRSSPPGVMIYVTGSASIDMKNNQVILSTIYPTPPGEAQCLASDAPYPGAPCGMVLWIANGTAFASQAGAITLFEGIFYAPYSSVRLQGTPGSDAQGVQIIVGQLELGGNGGFNLVYKEYVKLDSPRVFLVE